MKWTGLILLPLLLLAGCGGKTERSIDVQLDADFAKSEVLLTCKASSSGSCKALFLIDTERKTASAAAGGTVGVSVGEGAYYCVDVVEPDPAKCRPRPLVAGKQIVHASTVKS